MKLLNLLLKDEKIKILEYLENNEKSYPYFIYRNNISLLSYAVLERTLKLFEKLGLIITEKKGRTKYLYITEKGKKFLKKYRELCNLLRE